MCLQHLLLPISSSFLLLRKHFFSFGCHNLSSCVSWRGKERTVSCYLNGVGNLAFFFTPFDQGKKAKNNNTKFSSKEKSWWNANSFQMKRNGAVAGIGKKIPILIRFAQNLIRIQSQNLSHQDWVFIIGIFCPAQTRSQQLMLQYHPLCLGIEHS